MALRRVGRHELAGLFAEIEQDRIAVENEGALIVDRRHLAVWIDLEKFRLELVALAGVDRNEFAGQAGLFQEQRDLVRVWRTVEIEFEHSELSLASLPTEIGARRHCRRRPFPCSNFRKERKRRVRERGMQCR